MPKPNQKTVLKPYNIVIDEGANAARVDMYGEIVETRPIDLWTGQPMRGNFIALDEFLDDLRILEGKSRITIHINSVGGDMYAGIAIYNRLRALSGYITTINDGLAASAASVVFMAGDDRKMYAGSNLMIHEATVALYGYYKAQELRDAIKQLDAHNTAAIYIYSERTGRDQDEIAALVAAETWMTGQQAVDAGFATEVIADGAAYVDMKLTPDRTTMLVNGYPVSARLMGKIPQSVPVMSAAEWEEQTNIKIDSKKINTLTELQAVYPALLAQAESAAQAKERARIQGIDQIAAVVGNAEMVESAKYGKIKMNAEQLAFAALKAQSAIGATMLSGLLSDAQSSGAASVVSVPASIQNLIPENEDAQAIALMARVIKQKEGK